MICSEPVWKRKEERHGPLIAVGIPVILFAVIFCVRITWEETALTMRQGPQMIGFSLAHGSGAILFLSPLLLALWILVAVVTIAVSLFRKRKPSKLFWLTLASGLAVFGTVSIPDVFWQWVFISHFAKSPHAAELMTYAAARGEKRTVEAYLIHGVPLESTNYEGSTAAFTASAGGRVQILEMLADRGADLNAINSYGDSPLEAAVENKKEVAANFLKIHGAK